MATPRDLSGSIDSGKRRYRKIMQDMIFVLQAQLEHLEDEDFEPSASVDSGAFHLIQEANRLKALLEVKVEE